MISNGLRTQLDRFFPDYLVEYDSSRDVVLIEDPRTGMKQFITGATLRGARSVTDVLRYVKDRLNKGHAASMMGGPEFLPGSVNYWGATSSVGFYGKAPGLTYGKSVGRSYDKDALDDLVTKQSHILKENTMNGVKIQNPAGSGAATCPECLAPEEQEITVVDSVFSVRVIIEGEANTRKYIVNAFTSLDAIRYAVEVLQDEAEDGADLHVREVSAVEQVATEILI